MSEPTTKELLEKLARLEAAIETLTQRLEKQIKHDAGTDRLNTAIRMGLESEMVDVSERIKNVELTVFPNLSRDILQLHGIVPLDGKAWSPFDYRYPWKK